VADHPLVGVAHPLDARPVADGAGDGASPVPVHGGAAGLGGADVGGHAPPPPAPPH
jgi:hypothetical protein